MHPCIEVVVFSFERSHEFAHRFVIDLSLRCLRIRFRGRVDCVSICSGRLRIVWMRYVVVSSMIRDNICFR